jgi:hypothetical protein
MVRTMLPQPQKRALPSIISTGLYSCRHPEPRCSGTWKLEECPPVSPRQYSALSTKAILDASLSDAEGAEDLSTTV